MIVEQSPAPSPFCEVTAVLICPHIDKGTSDSVLAKESSIFLSPGLSSKLLTSILNILKLALYFTEKSMKCVLDNNQDL